MSNTITLELCAEDRARLDRLTAALERRACDKCAATAMAAMNAPQQPTEPDPIREALIKALKEDAEQLATDPELLKPAEASQEPAGVTEAETPATTQTPEEQPAAAADAGEAAPAATVDDIRARYVALVASGKKDAARDLIKSYDVAKISDIPADKCAEVMAKLNALEG